MINKCYGCHKKIPDGNIKNIVEVTYYNPASIAGDGCSGGSIDKSLLFHRKCFDKKKIDTKKYDIKEAIRILKKSII